MPSIFLRAPIADFRKAVPSRAPIVAVVVPVAAFASVLAACWVAFSGGETSLILAVVTFLSVMFFFLSVMFFGLIVGGPLAFDPTPEQARPRSFKEFLNGDVDITTGRISGRAALWRMCLMPIALARHGHRRLRRRGWNLTGMRHREDDSMTQISQLSSIAPPQQRRGPSAIVREFTPNWFAVTMGTGVLALALNQFVSAIPDLYGIALALWAFNIALFMVFSVLYAARWIFFFDGARRIFALPVASMFFGAIPMGLVTIINGFVVFGIPLWGDVALTIAYALWWIDVAMSIACGLLIPFFMFTRQDHSMEKMTAVWLLPIVAAEVAAASGGLLVPHLPMSEGYTLLLLSYVLWAMSVPLAMSILVILVLRLALHKLPERDMAVTGWLALGPIGTGALGLLLLGGDAPHVFAAAGLSSVGDVAFGIGVIGGTILWGYGVWWLLLAILKTISYGLNGMPFNLGWWGFTFPLGVYSLATLMLAHTTHVAFFSVVGAGLVMCLTAFWVIVAARTAHGAWHGYLFVAPCLRPDSVTDRFEADAA